MDFSLAGRPLADLDFIAFDVETTGCASATGRMVEIGAVRFRLDGTETGRFQRLVNPLRPIPAEVVRIHGITNAMVRDCPPEADVLPGLLDFFGDPAATVLMAHNARFDMAFVGSALARCGLPAPPHAVIDTVRLSRRRAAGLPSHSLRSLVRVFGIGDTTEHRGLSDSIALQRVFLTLAARPPALETADDLFRVASPYSFRAEPSAYRRRPGGSFAAEGSGADFVGAISGPAAPQQPGRSGGPLAAASSVPRVFGRGTSASDCCAEIASAIAAGRVVSLVYEGGRSAGSRRSVTPLRLVAGSPEVTYLLAFCHVERKQKQYRLDRIRDLVVE